MKKLTPKTKAQIPGRSCGVEWAKPIHLRSKEDLYGSFPWSSQHTPISKSLTISMDNPPSIPIKPREISLTDKDNRDFYLPINEGFST